MMKPRDQKTIATEKIVCYSQFLRGGDMPLHAGSHREAWGSVRRQGEQEIQLLFLEELAGEAW